MFSNLNRIGELMKPQKAFSLIELIMAVSLVSIIGLALYSNLNSGINIAARITRPLSNEDLAVSFEKISQEIANTFSYSEIPFNGEEQEFSLPAIIRSRPELGLDLAIGRVTYGYDSSHSSLSRRQEDMSQVYQEEAGETAPVLQNVSSASFQYFGFDKASQSYLWFSDWDSVEHDGKLPLAVRIELSYLDEGKKRELVRTISIPAGDQGG